MNGGDANTRRFAATVLDDFFDFTNRGKSYSKQIDWLHQHFNEDVKAGLYPKMEPEELAAFVVQQTLANNGAEDLLTLLYPGERI